MPEWLQVLVTTASIVVTGALLVRQLRRARRRIRLRPRLDVIRMLVQFTAVVVVAALMGTGAPLAALILVGLFAVGPGWVQGRNLEISDADGRLYAVRNTIAASVWGAGLVIMQVAGLLRRTGILGLGQATAWIGVGLAIGLFIGRRGPVAEHRTAAAAGLAPVAAATIAVFALATVSDGGDARAQTESQWTFVSQQVNPGGHEDPPGWSVTMGVSSISAVHSFGPDDPSGAEGLFEATWEPPGATLVPGDTLVIPVTATGRNTGNLETQYFFGLTVILIVDGRWNNQAVGAFANCAQTTVISGEYICSEPETNTGEMTTTVPTRGETWSVGIGALNCASCYVEWRYEFQEAAPAETAPAAGGDLDGDSGDIIDPAQSDDAAPSDDAASVGDVDDAASDDVEALDDFIDEQRDETGIEPDEAMAAAIAGVIAALATGGISLIEAMDQIGPIFEEGSQLERGQRPPDPAEPGAVVDEHGNVLLPGDDGLYDWETPSGVERIPRDELIERVAAERAAIEAKQSARDSIVTEQWSDAAAADRFGDMLERTIAQNDALMDEIRAAWDRIEARQSALDRRDTALSALEAAEAEQQYEGSRTSWDQVTLDAVRGMERDVAGLPGEVVDATRVVVTELADPENWRVLGETAAESVYDVLGMAAGNTFGDGAESIGNGVRFGGDLAAALTTALVTDPIGTIAALTPIHDFANAVDGDRTLGERLGSLGIGLVDIGATLAGVGMVGHADDLLDAARLAEAAADAVDTTRDTARVLGAAEDAIDGGRGAARATDALEDGLTGTARVADRALSREMIRTRDQIADAITTARAEAARRGVPVERVLADMPETRGLFQGAGMGGMGALESAGGLSDEMAQAVVRMHDEITSKAVDIGARNALDEMYEIGGMRPQRVLLGNSGSVGATRSVMTDADRTVVLVFSDDQLDNWRASRGLSRTQAQDALQRQFTDLHRRHAELALNDPTDPAVILAREKRIELQEAVARLQAAGGDDPAAAAVRLNRDQMDMQSYSGFGSLEGADDLYPAGFTQSRQSIQGSTDVYRIDPDTGAVTSYRTSGQAIVDQHELNRLQTTGSLTPTTSVNALDPDAWRWSDPTRIPDAELPNLLRNQIDAVDHYHDVKSIAKAVDRVEYIASRTGRRMADRTLVEASVAIRSNPRATAEILAGLGMSEQQFVESCQSMVRTYGTGT